MKSKNQYLSVCNVYIAVWCLYNLQGPIFVRGSMPMQILLVINLAISIYYAVYANWKYRLPDYLRALNLLVLMFTLYGGILIIGGERIIKHGFADEVIDNFTYLKSICISLLPVYPFYVFTREGMLTEKLLRRWFFLFLPMAIVIFLFRQQQAELMAAMMGSDREEFTNNAGYMFLQLIPLVVFFHRRPFVQYALLACCLLFILMGMKRGAILIGAICVLLFMWRSFQSSGRNQKYKFMLLSVVLVVAGYYAVEYYLQTSDYFNYRLEETMEGNSSQRDVLYGGFFSYFISQSNILNILFGNGANATLSIMGQYAHNDWLELAINQGILGIVIYLYYWYIFFNTWRRSPKGKDYTLALGLMLVIYFMKTIFSMSYGDMDFYATMALGFSVAQCKESL